LQDVAPPPADSTDAAARPRGSWILPATIASTLYGIAYLYLVTLGHGGRTPFWNDLGNVAFVPFGLIASIILFLAARNEVLDPGVRRALRWAAAGELALSLGNFAWSYLVMARGVDPTVSWVNALYFAYYPCALIALRSFPIAERERDEWWKFLFDAATVAVSGAMIVWYVLVLSTAGESGGVLSVSMTVAYPVGDFLVLLGLVTLLLRRPSGGNNLAFYLYCVSEFAGIVADLAYTLIYPAVGYKGAAWTDVVYVASYVLLIASGEVYLKRPEPRFADTAAQRGILDRNHLVSPLPYVAVACGYALLLFVALTHDSPAIVPVTIGAIALTVLVVARQVVVVRQNARLLTEQATADAVKASEARFRSIFDHSAVGMALVDAKDTLVETNHAFQEMLGYSADDLRGLSLTLLASADDSSAMALPTRELLAGTYPSATTEMRLRHRDGRAIWVSVTISRVESTRRDDPRIVCMANDITPRKELEAQLTHQAFHDALTNLANRALFRDRVERALANRDRRPGEVAVLFVDLDNFKTVNDSLGHGEGDRLLVAVAGRLLNATRGSDTVARVGGDEFAILLEGVADENEAAIVAERVTAALNAPFLLDERALSVRASIGIAVGRSVATADDLLRNADLAMYRAKTRGKGLYETFHPEMHAEVVDQLELEIELCEAVEREEFVLVYQPIVELDSERAIGFEALLRWRHPRRGVLPPAKFIALAERTGVIVRIGRWVLGEACRQGAKWNEARTLESPLSMTVNLSGLQLEHDDLVADVRNALEMSGLEPECLVLEITESAIIRRGDVTARKMQELRELGVRLAIDDFGTGYSSLAYLQRFPIDILKIDKTFIDGLGRGGRDAALARTIIALGEMMSLHTVAEGIERPSQRSQLRALGCGLGQGFLFAKPLSVEDASALATGSVVGGRAKARTGTG